MDKYTWVDFGDSYLPSELDAAYLWAQLLHADEINDDRMNTWNAYWQAFQPLAQAGKVELPVIPDGCVHNAHMFYIKCRDLAERTALIRYLKEHDILAVFHYIPLIPPRRASSSAASTGRTATPRKRASVGSAAAALLRSDGSRPRAGHPECSGVLRAVSGRGWGRPRGGGACLFAAV